ncbi:hypothetical protein CBR_g38215 [Chara braunii]|uniref:Uncharacterized protein n=1 Tax=Chara braunii TaxID=69332 RepID=A0A388LPL9_CHABU|nr:hypothetical protein CBR_g38215 [Chara braunii]|eukprot:GBG84244.1 hypothetical protein CBR_g38215 [Chara braunii]
MDKVTMSGAASTADVGSSSYPLLSGTHRGLAAMLTNQPLISAFLAFFIAQALKVLTTWFCVDFPPLSLLCNCMREWERVNPLWIGAQSGTSQETQSSEEWWEQWGHVTVEWRQWVTRERGEGWVVNQGAVGKAGRKDDKAVSQGSKAEAGGDCGLTADNAAAGGGRPGASQVMYDASGVRLQAGRQAEVLNQIVYELPPEHPLADARPLREPLGHTPPQVAAGAVVGCVLAYLLYLIGGGGPAHPS